jgi:hypothetical protein
MPRRREKHIDPTDLLLLMEFARYARGSEASGDEIAGLTGVLVLLTLILVLLTAAMLLR